MILSSDKLQLVFDTIETLRSKVVRANINDDEKTLERLLTQLGVRLDQKAVEAEWSIFLCAGTNISADDLYSVCREYDLDDRIEMELDYDKIVRMDFDRFRNSTKYRYILFGQMPHSVRGKKRYQSIIQRMNHEPEHYPTVIVLENHRGTPHLSINNLRKKLEQICLET
jgi:hypothetical protein